MVDGAREGPVPGVTCPLRMTHIVQVILEYLSFSAKQRVDLCRGGFGTTGLLFILNARRRGNKKIWSKMNPD